MENSLRLVGVYKHMLLSKANSLFQQIIQNVAGFNQKKSHKPSY